MRSLPASLAAFLRAEGDEVVVMDDFRGDEAALEIRVDHAGGGGGLVALVDRPGAGFLHAGGEIGAQAEQVIDGADQRGDAGIVHAHVLEKLGGFFRRTAR